VWKNINQIKSFSKVLANTHQMVLPITDEYKPKCYLCNKTLENIEELKKHQKSEHDDFLEFHKNTQNREPSPGDVTVF